MFRALLRRSVLGFAAIAAVAVANEAEAQGFDPNIVSRVDSFIPTSPQTTLPTKTEKVTVERTETVTVIVEEQKDLTSEEREALAKKMGVVVPLGLRSTTARKAYLNMRQVPTTKTVKVKKQKKKTFTEVVEKTLPRKTTVNAIASGGYTYATNANQADIDIIADSIDSQNANLLILVPAGREEDTVAFCWGHRRYVT
jgi:hypothetical protein